MRITTRIRTFALLACCVALASLGTPALAGKVDLSGLDSDSTNQRFIVRYRDGSAPARHTVNVSQSLNRASTATRQRTGRSFQAERMRTLSNRAELIRTTRALNRTDAEALMRQLAEDPDVDYVEVDRIMYPALVPNDTYLSRQWAMGTSSAAINVRSAWDKATGTGTVIAVLDTGTTSHPDLNGKYLQGYDFISEASWARDGNGRDSDPTDEGDWLSANECGGWHSGSNSSWHGTHVAGIAAATANNRTGIAGTAFDAKILPARVLGKCGGYTSDIADAITWASGGTVSGVPANANPAHVINLSLGGTGACSTTFQNAIDSAVARGTTVVVAAGNEGMDVSNASPANCANVIAVAATTSSGSKAYYSNYGTGVTISAPGSSIISTLNTGTTTARSASYGYKDGTSMATPYVAGVVALMQSVATTPLTPAEVTSILKSTARRLPGSCSGGCGSGIVNAAAAVDAVLARAATITEPEEPEPSANVLQNGVTVSGLAAARGGKQYFTITVPANSRNLVISKAAGGVGDPDVYVRLGSAPTTTSYTCRSVNRGTLADVCTIDTPSAGTYHIMLNGYSAYSAVQLTASYQEKYTNNNSYSIPDLSVVYSPIAVSDRVGNGPTSGRVSIDIVHTYRGDLVVDLVSPDGRTYWRLSNRAGGSAQNLSGTYRVNLSSKPINGEWKLRVRDHAGGNTGYIRGWSLTL